MLGRLGRNVDVEQTPGRHSLTNDPIDDIAGDNGGRQQVRVFSVLHRYGDARDAKKRPFDRRGDGTAIEDIDSRVEPAVDAANDQVRLPGTQLNNRELDTV